MNTAEIIETLRSGLTRSGAETFAATVRGATLAEVCRALNVPAGSVRDRQAALVSVAMRKTMSATLRAL